MAHFNNISDDQVITPAVELTPAVTVNDIKNHIKYDQTVSLLTSAYLRFNELSLIVIAKAIAFDLKGHAQNKNRNHFTEASIQSKLQFIALQLEFGATFSSTEINCLVGWLRKATDTTKNVYATNIYTEQERFAAQMLLLDLREILIPEISDTEPDIANRRQTRREAEEDIFGRD